MKIKLNRTLIIGFVAVALAATVAFAYVTSQSSESPAANPMAKLEVEVIESINFTPPLQLSPPNQPPTKIALPPNEHPNIIETLRDAEFESNPLKWQSAGDIIIRLSDGTVTKLNLYETGTNLGAFSISNTYYRFKGKLAL